jgi:ABC-type polysaccharide/polyol phosphate export permease
VTPAAGRGDEVTVRTAAGSAGGAFGAAAAWSLVCALVRRDLALHWRHTRLGVLWGVLPPLVAVGVLDLFLGRVAGLAPAAGTSSYAVFLYAGLLPWAFVSRAASSGAGSVVGNAWVVSQVRFPRAVLPLSHVIAGAPDFALGSLVLLCWTLAAGTPPGAGLLLLPVAVLAMTLLSVALAVLLSAAAVRVRDVLPATAYALQALFVASPVLYPLAAGEARVPRWVFLVNPATGVLETFRAAWLGTPLDAVALAASVGVSALLLAVGARLFAATHERFADLV